MAHGIEPLPSRVAGGETAPVAGDGASPVGIEELLRKHAGGEKLTPREYGQVGRHYQRTGTRPPGRPRKDGLPPGSTEARLADASRDAPRPTLAAFVVPDAGPVPSNPNPAVPLGGTVVDPEALRRCARAILGVCDRLTQSAVRVAAFKAGADKTTADEFAAAAAFDAGDVALMVDTSPDVIPQIAAMFGANAANLPLTVFAIGAAGCAVRPLTTISRIKELHAESAREPKPQPSPPPQPKP